MFQGRNLDCRNWNLRQPVWILVFAVQVSWFARTLSPQWLRAAGLDGTEESRIQPTLLKLGEKVERDLCCRKNHSYWVELESGQFLRVLIQQKGIDLGVAVFAPDSRLLRELQCHRGGPTSVSLIAGVSGEYRLEIASLEEGEGEGRYNVSIEQIRPVVASDENRVAGEKAFEEAEQLRWQWIAESSRKAIGKYKEAAGHWKKAGVNLEQARVLKAIGEVLHPLDEPEQALQYFDRAVGQIRKVGHQREESEILSSMGLAYLQLGEMDKAFELCTEALKLSRAAVHPRGEAQALNALGEYYYYSGDNRKALGYYSKTVSVWKALGDRRGEALALTNLASNYSAMGDESRALEHFTEALSLLLTAPDRRGQALTLMGLGTLYAKVGENQQALSSYIEAKALFEPMGDHSWEAAVVQGMGYVYDELGLTQKALEHYSKALQLRQLVRDPYSEGITLGQIGETYLKLGDGQKALDQFVQALATFRALDNPRMESVTLTNIGRAYLSLGDKKQSLAFLNQGLLLNKKSGYRGYLWGEAYTLSQVGAVYYEMGEKAKALSYFRQALPICEKITDRWGESSTLYSIALVERDLGNLREAREQIESALEIVESLRGNVASHGIRASYFASVHQYHELYIDLLMDMHRQWPSERYGSLAFLAAEKARARSLLDSLKEARIDVRQGVEPGLLDREQKLQRRLNVRAEQQMRLLSAEPDNKESAAIAKEIRDLTTEYEQVQMLIRGRSPRYAALTQPQPLSLEEIQEQVLDDETILLELALGEERSYLWAVTNKSHTSHELPNRVEIEDAAGRVHELLTARQPRPGETVREFRLRVKAADSQYWEVSGRLSKMLLGPVASQLGSKRLLVVSAGALQYVPFGALPVPGSTESVDGPVPLVVEHEIVRLPSASTLAVLRMETASRVPAEKRVAVLADPVFDIDDPRLSNKVARKPKTSRKSTGEESESLPVVSDLQRALRDIGFMQDGRLAIPRLPATRREAESIIAAAPPGESFKAIDFLASRATATSPELGQYRIVHFATHGLLNNEHPELSGIILSMLDEEGRPQNGFLRLHDIYNLDLPVELVVLSACNSGLGKQVRGEGLVGIVRGFMYAGAARVVASLWKVDDEATGELMKHFYREMLGKNLSPAAALRQAQIALWKQKSWSSPFYWAAFVLQGEWM